MDKLQQSKSLLTKLLATENLNVEFRNVGTASFNTANRTLTLPLWEDMSPELYDLLGGHEVGHALQTPAQGWHDAVTDGIGPGFRSFLNVVEDVRIENYIKNKYPGIRKSFSKGYRELIDRDFFGTRNQNPNTFLLIDRINLYFKGGASFGIEFKPEENVFINKIDQVKTWDEVVAVAKELYAYCRDELKQQYQDRKEMMQKMRQQGLDEFGEELEDYEDDGFGEDYSEWDEDEEDTEDNDSGNPVSEQGEKSEEPTGSSSESGDDDTEQKKPQLGEDTEQKQAQEKDKGFSGGAGGNDEPDFDPVSKTDKVFQEKVQSLTQKKNVNNGVIPAYGDMNLKDVVVDWKKIAGKVVYRDAAEYRDSFFLDFENKNKSAIGYLVKEFEMRKKASELRRVSLSDTGTIDTNLLHAYKFDDNIFRKIATVAEGKNHGLFILVDWSGSMSDNMKGTVEQMLVLTMFCRKIGVPFEVYAFSTEYRKTVSGYNPTRKSWITSFRDNDVDFSNEHFNLINLLSNRMSNQAYRTMANDLLAFSLSVSGYRGDDYNYDRVLRLREMAQDTLGLGGTPLNISILAISKMVDDFKIRNRVEIVNTIILSDGEDSSTAYTRGDRNNYGSSVRIGPESYRDVSYVFDMETKRNYKVKNSITEVLLQILKDRTGCNLLGFYIVTPRKSQFANALGRLCPNRLAQTEVAYNEFKNDKVHALTGVGYDEYYLIPGGDVLETDNDDLNDILGSEEKISTRRLKGAFLKMNQNRLTNRVLLKKFIEQVA